MNIGRRQRLKRVVLAAASIEVMLLLVLVWFLGFTNPQVHAAAILTLGLLLSLRYFWQRLSGKDAQFGNLVVRAGEPFDELDRWILLAHTGFAVVAWVLVLAYS